MSDGVKVLSKAGKLLRKHANGDLDTAAMAVAAATFVAMSTNAAKVEGQNTDDRLAAAMIAAANVLSPICPHCGKELRTADSASEAP